MRFSKLLCALAIGGAFTTACTSPDQGLDLDTRAQALAIEDTDVDVECEGILWYINWANYDELAYYLPNSLAIAILDRRDLAPFTSIADLSSVPGIAQGRLVQITGRAYTLDTIDADCACMYEEQAVSYVNKGKILNFVNNASEDTLQNAVPHNVDVAPSIIAGRPYTSLQQLVDRPQVGIASFRAIRNAAVDGPWEELMAAVNAIPGYTGVDLTMDFYWLAKLHGQSQPGQLASATCFGIDEDIVDDFGGTIRPTLADDDEVIDVVTDAIEYADNFNQLALDQTAGLADFAAWANGRTFFGCYLQYEPDPWSGVNRAIFVDTETDIGVLVDLTWAE
jgi:DNA uptake protein ComE-like DNA-binding protein